MEKIIKMKEKRAGLVNKAREIQAEAEKREKPELLAEERSQIEKIMEDVRQLNADIKTEEELRALEGSREPESNDPGKEGENSEMRAFNDFLRSGEARGLNAGTASEGGYFAPERFVTQLYHDMDRQFSLVGRADVVDIRGAGSLGVPLMTTDVSDADWTAEVPVSDITEDTDFAAGKRDLSTNPLTKLVKISRKLMNASALDPDGLVRKRLAYKFGKAMENGILNGTGSGQPLGIFTASANGVPTTRDVTAAGAAAITYADVINLIRKVHSGYDKVLICHDDFITKCMLLTDGNGRPLWMDSMAGDKPPTLGNVPYYESSVAPNTFSASQYVAAVADMKQYILARSQQVEISVLDQLFALKNQIGYLGYAEADGSPIVAEAFARLKLAAS